MLLSVNKIDHRNRKYHFKAVFQGLPLMQDVTDAQKKAGYHPAGYGRPMDVKSVPIGDEKFETTWCCFDSCY